MKVHCSLDSSRRIFCSTNGDTGYPKKNCRHRLMGHIVQGLTVGYRTGISSISTSRPSAPALNPKTANPKREHPNTHLKLYALELDPKTAHKTQTFPTLAKKHRRALRCKAPSSPAAQPPPAWTFQEAEEWQASSEETFFQGFFQKEIYEGSMSIL